MKTYRDLIIEMAEYKAFHGTPRVFEVFEYDGTGNDALGAGYYFADNPYTANHYTGNEGDETQNANIRLHTIVMDKPIILDEKENPKQRPLTAVQLRKLILAAPDWKESLYDFGDWEYEGLEKVLRRTIENYRDGWNLFEQVLMIMREFYHKELEVFAAAMKKTVGYDGIIKEWNAVDVGREDRVTEDVRWFIVWSRKQILPYFRSGNKELTESKYPSKREVLSMLRSNLYSIVDYRPLAAYIVGSEAKGSARDDSDLDIAVVIPKSERITALKRTERYHQKFRRDGDMPTWNGRRVDFQFFYPDDPELSTYSKIAIFGNDLNESVSSDTLFRMKEFGLSRADIDSEGYITVYHGGAKLPRKLNKDEIFFLSNSREVAEDYAKMRHGQVFELRVRPDDVLFNTGSNEIEYDKGGSIVDGKIVPPEQKKRFRRVGNLKEYRGFGIGDNLPKSGFTIRDIIAHDNGNVQMLLKTNNGDKWYAADTIINYEVSK